MVLFIGWYLVILFSLSEKFSDDAEVSFLWRWYGTSAKVITDEASD